MKKKAVIGVFVASLFIISATAFAMADSEERIVRDLINLRTNTLNEYYDGSLTKEEARKVIKETESGNLMEQDLDNIERYFQTDIDQVEGFKIKSIDITQADDDMICADVYMTWEVETVTGSDVYLCQYSVICEKEKNSYKLVQFF